MTANSPFIQELTPGTIVGERYTILSAHRQGGLSVAFEVRDQKTGEKRELQFFSSALFEADDQANEFASSWDAWQRINSPSVIAVTEVLRTSPGGMVLVTGFPFGLTLRKVLAEAGALDSDSVIRLGVQLLEGLEQVHAAGLVHGDIKPNTIFLEGRGEELAASMVDGGITSGLWSAKDLGEKTALIGTPYYAPVEQFGGDSPDVQSDVYNVGTVLYEAITGVMPWRGSNFLEVFQSKLEAKAPSMKELAPDVEVDPALERAIAGSLTADRKDRYATAKSFLKELRPFVD